MKYKVFEHDVLICGSLAKSYGIIVFDNNIIFEKHYDVSLNKEKVEQLVSDLNLYKVEKIHLKGIIDDFLVDNF